MRSSDVPGARPAPALAPGVTAYPVLGGSRPGVVSPAWLVVMAVIAVVGLAGALTRPGANLVVVVVVAVGALLLPPALVRLSWLWRLVILVVVLVAVLAVVASSASTRPAMLVLTSSTVAGLMVLWWWDYHRWWQQRQASALGAPSSGIDVTRPKIGRPVLWWRDVHYEYEVVDPSVEQALDLVRGLDGESRTIASVFRGTGRLDVGGDARDLLVVQHSVGKSSYVQLVDPSADTERRRVSVLLDGGTLTFDRRMLVGLPQAEQVLRTWMERGERDGASTWEKQGVLRPGSLKAMDIGAGGDSIGV